MSKDTEKVAWAEAQLGRDRFHGGVFFASKKGVLGEGDLTIFPFKRLL